jgi:hypothetical protein
MHAKVVEINEVTVRKNAELNCVVGFAALSHGLVVLR